MRKVSKLRKIQSSLRKASWFFPYGNVVFKTAKNCIRKTKQPPWIKLKFTILHKKLCFFGSLLGVIDPSGVIERGVTLITYQVRFNIYHSLFRRFCWFYSSARKIVSALKRQSTLYVLFLPSMKSEQKHYIYFSYFSLVDTVRSLPTFFEVRTETLHLLFLFFLSRLSSVAHWMQEKIIALA